MTLRQLINARVPMVRRPEWNPGTTLAFHFTEDNFVGPWVTLTDISCQTSNKVLILEVLDDDRSDWEPAT